MILKWDNHGENDEGDYDSYTTSIVTYDGKEIWKYGTSSHSNIGGGESVRVAKLRAEIIAPFLTRNFARRSLGQPAYRRPFRRQEKYCGDRVGSRRHGRFRGARNQGAGATNYQPREASDRRLIFKGISVRPLCVLDRIE